MEILVRLKVDDKVAGQKAKELGTEYSDPLAWVQSEIGWLEESGIDAKGFYAIASSPEEYIEGNLKAIEPYQADGNKRPNDLMDCGYADGQWDAYVNMLDYLGITH